MDGDEAMVPFAEKLENYERATASSSNVTIPKSGLECQSIDGTVSVPEEVAKLDPEQRQ